MIDFNALGTERLQAMATAGLEVLECHRVLAKTGDNIVSEVLPREGGFYEFDHCPPGDVYDTEAHSQYYYHAQPSWPTNRWVTAMCRLFQPQIVALLGDRDALVADWRERYPDEDVFEVRRLDLPSRVEISLDGQIRAVRTALEIRC